MDRGLLISIKLLLCGCCIRKRGKGFQLIGFFVSTIFFSSDKAVGSSSDVSDNSTNPVASETLSVGDTCVFHISSTQWKIGRIF